MLSNLGALRTLAVSCSQKLVRTDCAGSTKALYGVMRDIVSSTPVHGPRPARVQAHGGFPYRTTAWSVGTACTAPAGRDAARDHVSLTMFPFLTHSPSYSTEPSASSWARSFRTPHVPDPSKIPEARAHSARAASEHIDGRHRMPVVPPSIRGLLLDYSKSCIMFSFSFSFFSANFHFFSASNLFFKFLFWGALTHMMTKSFTVSIKVDRVRSRSLMPRRSRTAFEQIGGRRKHTMNCVFSVAMECHIPLNNPPACTLEAQGLHVVARKDVSLGSIFDLGHVGFF